MGKFNYSIVLKMNEDDSRVIFTGCSSQACETLLIEKMSLLCPGHDCFIESVIYQPENLNKDESQKVK